MDYLAGNVQLVIAIFDQILEEQMGINKIVSIIK